MKAVFDFTLIPVAVSPIFRLRLRPRFAIIQLMPPTPGPLVREVEFPRRASAWGPILALLAAAMVTIMTGIAVTARPPHPARAHVIDHRALPAAVIAPAEAPVVPASTRHPAINAAATPDHDRCGDRVRRATPEGDVAAYEACSAPR